MKRAALSLLILGLCAAAIFFIGWVDLLVPHGKVAVVRSKTSGIHPHLVGRGSFTWMWERLLPTNTDIIILNPKRLDRSFSAEGSLPSADIYRQIVGSTDAFSWALAGQFSFGGIPSNLVELVSSAQVNNNDELVLWYERRADDVEATILHWFSAGNLDSLWSSDGLTKGLPSIADDIRTKLEREYPDLPDITLSLDAARYPDIALYRSAAELYRIQITNQQAVLEAALLETSRTGIYTKFTLAELERYGALFEKYPSLISFTLALEAGTDGIKELLSRLGTR